MRQLLRGTLTFLVLLVAGLTGAREAHGQRLIPPIGTAPRAARTRLPDVLAVKTDSVYQLLVPSLFERRQVFRMLGGEWTTVETVVARDSVRGATEVTGRAVGLYVDGALVGTGRVREVQLNLCAEPPAWCPPTAVVGVIGTLEREGGRVVAASPPANLAAETVEPTEDEVGAASRALLTVLRAAVGARARVREDQMATPNVYAIDDRAAGRRLLVAATLVDLGGAGTYGGLVIGVAGDTLLRSPSGRAGRSPAGATRELQLVSALDLNEDGALELLLGWLAGTEWNFEVLRADRLGRWSVHWSGPDRTPPAAGPRGRR